MVQTAIKFPEITDAVTNLKILIVSTLWNPEIVDSLVLATKKAILEEGVQESQITYKTVPGSWELVAGIQNSIQEGYHVIIPIGCLIKGATMHFEYISEGVARGLMDLQIKTEIPILYGVLNCLSEEQARERAGLVPESHNHGKDWGSGAVRMGLMYLNRFK
jgi:6,7-dimethyl-8-ribityllumazine synthase